MKRKLALSLVLVLLIGLLAGCKTEQKMMLSKDEVLAGVSQDMKSLKSCTFTAKLDMLISLSYMGESQSAAVSIDAKGEYTSEPKAIHYIANLDADGEEQYGEAYLFMQETETVSYTREDPNGAFNWNVKESDPKTVSEQQSGSPLTTLDWQMEIADDRYILTHTLTEEDSKSLMAVVGSVDALNELFSMDGLVDTESGLAGVKLTMEVNSDLQLLSLSADFTPLVSAAIQIAPGLDTTGTRAVLSFTLDNHNSAIQITPPKPVE